MKLNPQNRNNEVNRWYNAVEWSALNFTSVVLLFSNFCVYEQISELWHLPKWLTRMMIASQWVNVVLYALLKLVFIVSHKSNQCCTRIWSFSLNCSISGIDGKCHLAEISIDLCQSHCLLVFMFLAIFFSMSNHNEVINDVASWLNCRHTDVAISRCHRAMAVYHFARLISYRSST